MVVWTYLRTTQPAVLGGAGHLAQMAAGGGVIPTLHYALLMFIACAMAASFVLAGHMVCQRTGFLNTRNLSSGDLGVFYFVGMSVFLSVYSALAMISGRAGMSVWVMVVLLVAASVYSCRRQRVFQRSVAFITGNARSIAVISPLAVAVLCTLHYLVTMRGGMGTGWFYDDLGRYVVTLNKVPLVNRHYGQSLLSSVGLFVVGVGSDRSTYPQVALDAWLFLSQIALAFVFHRFLREMGVSRLGCWIGAAILMTGNTALSLLPHIVYDHDYPYVMNLYTDSLFGIAGWLMVVMYLIQRCRHAGRDVQMTALGRSLIVPALIVFTFNATAELNILVVLLLVAVLMAVNLFRRVTRFWIPYGELTVMLLVFSAVAVAGAFQGGVFAGRVVSAERRAGSPFWELDADTKSSRMSLADPRWWYLPYIVLGLPTGFGNQLVPQALMSDPGSPAAAATLESPASPNVAISANERILDRIGGAATPPIYKFVDAAELFELRATQTLRVIWFPVFGLVALGVLVARSSGAGLLRAFWCIAAVSFIAGVAGAVFTNSVGGDAFYWKWALTRLSEPGMCLAMVAFVVVADRFASTRRSRLAQYAFWGGLASFMAFGTFLRIFLYPSFNG